MRGLTAHSEFGGHSCLVARASTADAATAAGVPEAGADKAMLKTSLTDEVWYSVVSTD